VSTIISIIVGYVCGSIPFGLLLARAAGLGDIRNIGSGNIGATNVLRTGNKSIAALTLVCDVLKGFVPVVLGTYLAGLWGGQLAGFAAIAGHIFPVWLGFKGGKGVATAVGILFGWSWPVAIVGLCVWVLVFAARRISSLSALSAALIAVPAAYYFNGLNSFIAVAILAVVIWITHRANIRRLLSGTEPKSSFSKAT
jgi:acyl phosphate:glycerol-3-phosphate acyltransferase